MQFDSGPLWMGLNNARDWARRPSHKLRLCNVNWEMSTVTVDDSADETCVDCFAVSLSFDQLENCVRHLFVQRFEQIVPPSHQGQLRNKHENMRQVSAELLYNITIDQFNRRRHFKQWTSLSVKASDLV